MTLEADAIVERRRLRRRVSFWRIAALLLAAVAIIVLGLRLTGVGGGSKSSAHVARVELSGVILGSDTRHKMFRKLEKSHAKALLLEIDSPGGGVTASEELYDDIRAVAAKMPVVAVIGSVAASGGYIAALASDHIVARQTSTTGSIGVLAQYPNVTDLLSKLGVTVEEVKSAPLKAAPNGFTPTSPEARAALKDVIMDSFAWFKSLVGERRHMSAAEVETVADGRIYTGRQALQHKLIDQLGGDDEARAWLAKEKGVSSSLPVVDWKPSDGGWSEWGLARSSLAGLADLAGMPVLAARIRHGATSADVQALDGILAIWHPSLNH